MAVNSSDLITAAQYNGLQSRIEQVLGVGSGDFGYGQSVQSSQVQAGTDPSIPDGDTITAQKMNDLRTDMNKAFRHQTGNDIPLPVISKGDIIGADALFSDLDSGGQSANLQGGFNDFLNEITSLENNRLTIDSSQSRIEIKASDERTTDWNSLIGSEFTVTFGDAEARRHFFNAGGETRISGIVDLSTSQSGSGQKDNAWADIIENIGEFQFGINYNVITGDSDGVSFPNGALGDRGLTGSYQTVMRKDAGSGIDSEYSESYWIIQARNDNNSTIRFKITLVDKDEDNEPVKATFDFSTARYDTGSFDVSSQDATPTGIAFNNTGTKMFMVGSVSESIHQYSLSTAFDLSTASYDNVSFYVGSEDIGPEGIAFNDTGTKMFMMGAGNDSVFQYSFSTGFDLATASYDSVSFGVGSEDTIPRGIAFNDTGTKMFMVGWSSESVHQYSLSTAFDLSTASYDSVSFGVGSEDTSPQKIAFNDTGTKMFMLGAGSSSVHQYSLSTAFDLATASYDSVSFGISTEDTNARGIAFNESGTKMFMVGANSDSVYQYSLSTAFDFSTFIYDAVSLDVLTEGTSPAGIAFNDTGTKMFTVDFDTRNVHQYSLSTAFDLSTASYDNVALDVSTEDTAPTGIAFSDTGTTMFIVGNDSNSVHQYSLSTAFDLATASYDSVSFGVGSEDSGSTGIAFNDTGTTMFMVGWNTVSVYQYSLSTAFDLATASYDSVSFDVSTQDTQPRGIAFNKTGTKMFMVGWITDIVYQYSLSTAFDLATASYDAVSFDVSSQDTFPAGIAFNDTGTKMFMVGVDSDSVHQYSFLTISNDTGSFDVSSEDNEPRGIALNDTGTKMFMVGYGSNSIYQYSLSTAFDLATASYDGVSFGVGSEDGAPTGIAFSDTGTTMFMVGFDSDSVHQYSLSTAFDLATASYDGVSFGVGSEESAPQDIAFNDTGTKMFMVGWSSESVHQYSLSTAFDLATASYDSVSFDVSTEETGPRGIAFNDTGTKMFMVGAGSDRVYRYSLSTAFDLATASYDSVSFDVSTEDVIPQGIAFNDTGTKMFMVGNENNSVYQYFSTGEITNNDSSNDDEPVTADITFEYIGRTADGAVVRPFPNYNNVNSFE